MSTMLTGQSGARSRVDEVLEGLTPHRVVIPRRAAVSRAFYAAFNYARPYATQFLGFVPRTRPEDRSQDQGRLRAHLYQRRQRRVADALHTLRDLRNRCDYVDDLPGLDLSQTAADALAEAEYVITSLTPPTTGP